MPSLPSSRDARRHAVRLLLDKAVTPRSSRLDTRLTAVVLTLLGLAALARIMKTEALTGWARIGDGWAFNLDRTDAAKAFSLPRLEIHPSPRGWSCRCLLLDGTSHEVRGLAGSIFTAKRAAVGQAHEVLGAPHAGVLEELLEGAG